MEGSGHSVKVIGHKNPDTDSICAAIAYAELKNAVDPARRYVPCRAGLVNRESKFALDYFGVEQPRLTTDVSPQLKDVDYRLDAGVDASLSLRRGWDLLGERNADTLCVVDGENLLRGLVTIKDMATAYLERRGAGGRGLGPGGDGQHRGGRGQRLHDGGVHLQGGCGHCL